MLRGVTFLLFAIITTCISNLLGPDNIIGHELAEKKIATIRYRIDHAIKAGGDLRSDQPFFFEDPIVLQWDPQSVPRKLLEDILEKYYKNALESVEYAEDQRRAHEEQEMVREEYRKKCNENWLVLKQNREIERNNVGWFGYPKGEIKLLDLPYPDIHRKCECDLGFLPGYRPKGTFFHVTKFK